MKNMDAFNLKKKKGRKIEQRYKYNFNTPDMQCIYWVPVGSGAEE